MNTIDISCERIEVPEWIEGLRAFVQKILELLNIDKWEVSFLLCDDYFMRELNLQYRDIDEPTDVLSFAIHADRTQDGFSGTGTYDTIIAGDVVISLDTWERQSAELGIDPEEELKRLVVHGILHLTGMNHETKDIEKEAMLQKQDEILRLLTGEKIF
jgi:probable rRNA maturation factor